MTSLKLMLVLLLAATGASAQTVSIKGTVTGDTKGKNKVYITDLNAYKDSATIQNGRFALEIAFKGPQALFMHMEYEPGYRPFRVVFDKAGTINAQMDVQSYVVKFSGLETPTIFNDFNNKEIAMHRQVNEELKKKFGSAFLDQGTPNYNALMLERDRLSKEKMLDLLREQVSKFPGSYATTYALADLTVAYPLVLKEELYNKLSAAGKATEKGKELNAMIQGTKNSVLGSTVADFTLYDIEGKAISFSKYKGRYVLVDFWASWCSPCRASFPRLKHVYEKLHKKGLEILSVSIDADKKNWLKAVGEDNLPWTQVLDTKQIAKIGFAVSAIPNIFLISPEGKLLFKELGSDPNGGTEMEKKLEEIFKEKI
ncbi:Thiol-disulfide isomerase or thioredoxin [Pedobacter steynii]|uniref:Thiol-disulfide isomerase or thioredoxin n=1 Tax=Pedobacter steynii TaxID=430522 RepID=A0A1G9K9C5_9SPHI|nr:TlpA disulfide reductase family protein [Pedobacter steynii]NQX38480.1 AhpC/TSA family protein [Pedobacter steynii]SDL46024.1 Thiol-disulfide isomerase or thioredoxin [Pedobacter steynii]